MEENNKTAVDGLDRTEYDKVMDKILKDSIKDKDKVGFVKEHLKLTDKKVDMSPEELQALLRKSYDKIVEILREYCCLRDDYYSLIAVWILGTYFHDKMESYPYLFLNAMKGSGKTRLLKLIASMSHNGKILASLREAVLFRTAKGSTICIDEFESLGNKERGDLRELLNTAYKKGISVERMKKITTPEGSEQVVEAFELYCPIAMANIWGMEDVLGDRCIPLTLEKVNDVIITKLIENFVLNLDIQWVKSMLKCIDVVTLPFGGIVEGWNKWVKSRYTTAYTYTTLTTETTLTTLIYEKIDKTGLNGRSLELFFPLFLISWLIGEDVLDQTLETAQEINQERMSEEIVENKDINFIEFVAQQEWKDFIEVSEITKKFREALHEDSDDIKWINAKWVGKALRRLNFNKMKRRTGKGIEVILNIEKAKEKLKIFKPMELKPKVTEESVKQSMGD